VLLQLKNSLRWYHPLHFALLKLHPICGDVLNDEYIFILQFILHIKYFDVYMFINSLSFVTFHNCRWLRDPHLAPPCGIVQYNPSLRPRQMARCSGCCRWRKSSCAWPDPPRRPAGWRWCSHRPPGTWSRRSGWTCHLAEKSERQL